MVMRTGGDHYFLVAALGLCLATMLALGACSETTPRTQLMLVADTDITNLTEIRFEVSGNGETQSALTNDLSALPATLALVPAGDSLGPVMVTARGMRGSSAVVSRSAEVSFVARETLVVQLHLLDSCRTTTCSDPSQTCTEEGCQPKQIESDALAPWSGEAPRLPEGSSDAGMPDASNPNDAGERVDCGMGATNVDLQTDVNHCGMCKNVCRSAARNTVPVCTNGECGSECRSAFGDCDDNLSNGCEQALTTPNNCGMCGMQCSTGTSCSLGACR